MSDFPCLNCPDRVVGCHGKCGKYKKAKTKHESDKENQAKARCIDGYLRDRVSKNLSDVARKPKMKYGRHR